MYVEIKGKLYHINLKTGEYELIEKFKGVCESE